MGLETATYTSGLDASNPLAGDQKKQGDDHLRLIKSTIKNTFPNGSKPFYFPDSFSFTGSAILDATFDQKTVLMDATGGVRAITLPTPAYVGFGLSILKTAGANPVYVVPPSGSILSTDANAVSKIRIDALHLWHHFYWMGTWLHHVEAPRPGTIELYGGPVLPTGYGTANGMLMAKDDCPELFTVWGSTYGSTATHFNAPDLRDRFVVGSGASYAIAATGGEATHILLVAEMPVHSHTITQNPHDHGVSGGTTGSAQSGVDTAGGNSPNGIGAAIDVSPANADITINNAGSSSAHENRPPYFALPYIFRFC